MKAVAKPSLVRKCMSYFQLSWKALNMCGLLNLSFADRDQSFACVRESARRFRATADQYRLKFVLVIYDVDLSKLTRVQC